MIDINAWSETAANADWRATVLSHCGDRGWSNSGVRHGLLCWWDCRPRVCSISIPRGCQSTGRPVPSPVLAGLLVPSFRRAVWHSIVPLAAGLTSGGDPLVAPVLVQHRGSIARHPRGLTNTPAEWAYGYSSHLFGTDRPLLAVGTLPFGSAEQIHAIVQGLLDFVLGWLGVIFPCTGCDLARMGNRDS